jgi:hypothetical protein
MLDHVTVWFSSYVSVTGIYFILLFQEVFYWHKCFVCQKMGIEIISNLSSRLLEESKLWRKDTDCDGIWVFQYDQKKKTSNSP